MCDLVILSPAKASIKDRITEKITYFLIRFSEDWNGFLNTNYKSKTVARLKNSDIYETQMDKKYHDCSLIETDPYQK